MIWYRPLSSGVLPDLPPVPKFSVLTLAFGTTPPDGSVTVPPMAPSVVDCPLAEGVVTRHRNSAKINPTTKTAAVALFMEIPPSEIRMSATSAPTGRSKSRHRGGSLSDRRLFPQSHLVARITPRHHRLAMFLAHEGFVSNAWHGGYLRKNSHALYPICGIQQSALVSFCDLSQGPYGGHKTSASGPSHLRTAARDRSARLRARQLRNSGLQL